MNFILAECTRESFLNRFCETPLIVDNQHYSPKNKQFLPSKQNLVSGLFSALKNDPDLVNLVKVWKDIPKHIGQAIKALVQTHTKENK